MPSSVYRILYIKQNPQIYSLTEQFVFSFTLAPIDMGVFFFHEFYQLNSLALCLEIITTEKTNVLFIIVLTYLYRLVIVEEDIISICQYHILIPNLFRLITSTLLFIWHLQNNNQKKKIINWFCKCCFPLQKSCCNDFWNLENLISAPEEPRNRCSNNTKSI